MSKTEDLYLFLLDSYLFEGFLFALAEILIFKLPLTEFSLQPLNAFTQSKLVPEKDTKKQNITVFNVLTAPVSGLLSAPPKVLEVVFSTKLNNKMKIL